MKLLFAILGMVCWTMSANCQSQITGRIKDTNQYLPFATVKVLKDSVAIQTSTTDSLGRFVFNDIPPGEYLITASMIGYTAQLVACRISGMKLMSIEDIILEETSTALNEVVVTARKELVEQAQDRMTINVASNISTAGNTVLEVLQKSPGVVVNKQFGTIAINGKSGVRIMINEKIIQVPADVAVQMLDGMNASNVEKIELITTPSSNYDAEGGGGIIHIVTKSNTDFGTNGSAAVTLGAHAAETLGGMLHINHRVRRAAYFVDYSITRNRNQHKMKMFREGATSEGIVTTVDNSPRENITTQQNLGIGAEWRITKQTTLNALVNAYKRNWRLDAVSHDSSNAGHENITSTSMGVVEKNIWQSAAGSLGINHQINQKNKVDLTIDYLYYHNNNPSTYTSQDAEGSNIDLSKSTPIHFFIASSNYKHASPEASFSWDAGIKAVVSSLNNDVNVKRLVSNEWITDPVFTSNATLHEKVMAAYLSTQWNASPVWQIKGGLRYEYTNTLITSVTNENVLKRRYGYLFPTLSIKRNISSNSEVNLSYTRRIARPTYNDIAPYVFFWGPNSFSSGNTSLYPAISDAVTIGYQLSPWSINLSYTTSKKEIATMQPEVDYKTNSLIYRSQNLKYLNTLAVMTTYSFNPFSWWETQGTVGVQYQSALTSYLPNNKHISLYGVNITINSAINLGREFSFQFSGVYQSKSISGISNFLPMGSLNAGVQKKFGRGGTLQLAIDDIFRTNLWRIKTSSADNNLNVYFRYDFHNQFVRLTYTWNLGNLKLRSVNVTSGSEEERKRVN